MEIHKQSVFGTTNKFEHRFLPAGAEAFRRDLPKAEIHLIEAGHFALISNVDDVLGYMLPFLQMNLLSCP